MTQKIIFLEKDLDKDSIENVTSVADIKLYQIPQVTGGQDGRIMSTLYKMFEVDVIKKASMPLNQI